MNLQNFDKDRVKLYLKSTAYTIALLPSQIAFADDGDVKLNTKYFSNKEEFWKTITTFTAWASGLLWFVAIVLTIIGASVSSSRISRAKMAGNSAQLNKEAKNYAQFFINIAFGIGFIAFMTTLAAFFFGFKVSK